MHGPRTLDESRRVARASLPGQPIRLGHPSGWVIPSQHEKLVNPRKVRSRSADFPYPYLIDQPVP